MAAGRRRMRAAIAIDFKKRKTSLARLFAGVAGAPSAKTDAGSAGAARTPSCIEDRASISLIVRHFPPKTVDIDDATNTPDPQPGRYLPKKAAILYGMVPHHCFDRH
ncbi:hypothetical protein J2Z19_005400 [Ensifer adhaerens]|uniref:Uncharacterized protein n=1 Tax=Ensifer adhaerens TaxID=106592 RepID=A0ACC5T486_ENSAD|nr:hypothetical protein [Ensifer adhaerens]MBP1875663.1 hypothetical protein [Ensifer adhaerens]